MNLLNTLQNKDFYKFYLIIHNIQKYKNIGTLIRSGVAFNIAGIFIVTRDHEQKVNMISKNL